MDITTLAYEKLVDVIVLVAGDSDFVPAAKHARIKGIDFILIH
ncbi:NYN domain-containing protein [Escherichia coli]|nr:NYN domain-containing protein [Escherichia coli]